MYFQIAWSFNRLEVYADYPNTDITSTKFIFNSMSSVLYKCSNLLNMSSTNSKHFPPINAMFMMI